MAERSTGQVALDVEQIVLEAVEQFESLRQAAVLFELSLGINAQLDDVDRILNLVLTAAIDQQRVAETGSLFRLDGPTNSLVMVCKRGRQGEVIQYTQFAVGKGVAGAVAEAGQTIVINENCASDYRYQRYTARAEQLKSILAVPIKIPGSGELLGVLCVHNSQSDSGFGAGQQVFVEGLARIAGVAWSNALTHSRLLIESHYDEDTGLLNRSGITEVLRETAAKAVLSGQPMSVLFIDLDGLKRLNDEYDYATGNAAIAALVEVLKTKLPRRRARAGRWMEGDEFVVVLAGTTADEARGIAEDVRRAVEEAEFRDSTGGTERTTVSIGVAERQPEQSVHQLMLVAEKAIGRAKEAGRNQVSD